MLKALLPELNLHIFSFLSDREIATCAQVTKESNLATNKILLERMNEFSIGRERLKALCLLNPKLAKIGIDIDANRARYLLLGSDLLDIAKMNPEVARSLFTHVRLQKTHRLKSDLSSALCQHFPELATEIFSEKELPLPSHEEIIEIITKHPGLFNQLFRQPRFMHSINKSETLIKLSLINENIALAIFTDSEKFSKFDAFWYTTEVGHRYEDIALKILGSPKFEKSLCAHSLLSLGEKHIEVAKIVIENAKFTAKLTEEELSTLQDKVIAHMLSHTASLSM